MASAVSILFLAASCTALKCSAMLPTMGTTISPTKNCDRPMACVASSTVDTIASASHAGAQPGRRVTDGRAGDRPFDERQQPLAQRQPRDDQLGGVAEGGVEQAAPLGPDVVRQVLRRVADEAGHGDDPGRGERE